MIPLQRIAWVALFGVACGGAPVDTAPVDTDSDTDVVDTDKPGPCPAGAPEACVAFDGAVCIIDDPDQSPVGWGAQWPDDVRGGAFCGFSGECGHVVFFPCGGGRWFATVAVDGADIYPGGLPNAENAEVLPSVTVYDPESREQVATGAIRMGTPCPVRWYGEAEAAVCYAEWLAIFSATSSQCRASEQATCDTESCRIDLVTGFSQADCADYSPPP